MELTFENLVRGRLTSEQLALYPLDILLSLRKEMGRAISVSPFDETLRATEKRLITAINIARKALPIPTIPKTEAGVPEVAPKVNPKIAEIATKYEKWISSIKSEIYDTEYLKESHRKYLDILKEYTSLATLGEGYPEYRVNQLFDTMKDVFEEASLSHGGFRATVPLARYNLLKGFFEQANQSGLREDKVIAIDALMGTEHLTGNVIAGSLIPLNSRKAHLFGKKILDELVAEKIPEVAPKVGGIGRPYTGDAFRVDIENWGIPQNATAADIVRFEREELGNEFDIPDDMLRALDNYRSSDVVWVTGKKSDASFYLSEGMPSKDISKVELPPNSRIIAEDGQGGYLVLRGDAKPIKSVISSGMVEEVNDEPEIQGCPKKFVSRKGQMERKTYPSASHLFE